MVKEKIAIKYETQDTPEKFEALSLAAAEMGGVAITQVAEEGQPIYREESARGEILVQPGQVGFSIEATEPVGPVYDRAEEILGSQES